LEENLKVKYSRAGVFCAKSATAQPIICNKKITLGFYLHAVWQARIAKMQVFITLTK
jgi:hypothetical protein